MKKQPDWLTAYGHRGLYDLTIWMRNSSISDFKERLEQNGVVVYRICRGFKKELT